MSALGLVTLAAEAAGEEHNQTPFHVLGGLLAVYAVALAFLGMRGRAGLVSSTGARNAVMALTTVLVAAAMASAVLTS
jgi:hypothetical protein